MIPTPLVELRQLVKTYGRRQVLRRLNLTIFEPETLAIIGPNGSGKTTLLRLIAGLVRASSGTVRLGGSPPPRGLKRLSVTYFAGEATLPPSTSTRAWVRVCTAHEPSAGSLLDQQRRLGTLSRGTRQLVGLQAALARANTQLLVLDEPWEGLDPDASRWLTATIRSKRTAGVAVVVSSHRLYDLAGLCDRYAVLSSGSLVFLDRADLAVTGGRGGDALLAAFDRVRRVET